MSIQDICSTVQKHHSFFWNSELTPERMKEISDWIGSLSKEDRRKLRDVLKDAIDECRYDYMQREV